MAKKFSAMIERDAEGYYVATVPGIRGCHAQAKSLDERMPRVKEVVELSLEDPEDQADALGFVGVQKVRVNP